jgi:hypothetical protein
MRKPEPSNRFTLKQTVGTLEQCLSTLDALALELAAAHLSHCIDILRAEVASTSASEKFGDAG